MHLDMDVTLDKTACSINPFVCDLAMMVPMVPMAPSLPNHKRMDLLKKVTNMNLPIFNNKFLILNKVFEILNF